MRIEVAGGRLDPEDWMHNRLAGETPAFFASAHVNEWSAFLIRALLGKQDSPLAVHLDRRRCKAQRFRLPAG